MRRSQAPSCRTSFKPVSSSFKSNPPTENKLEPGKALKRSTDNILSLVSSAASLKNENQVEKDVIETLDEALGLEPQPTITVSSSNSENTSIKIFNVVYGKQSKKKHKTWEGDGTLEIYEKHATLKDETGKAIGSVPLSKCKQLEEGSRIFVGSKEVELIDLVAEQVSKKAKVDSPAEKQPILKKKFEPLGKKPPALRNPLMKNFDGLMLPEPNAEHQWYFNKENLPVTPVFIDSSLSRRLRQHQQIGITFLYECIMGFKENNLTGAILADEMGLGKTLQCIALIWTLLKRGPYGNRPVVKRVLIVTPSSLTMNWYNEFIKWLGRERLVPYVVDQNKKPSGLNNCPVMIISYEMFVRCYEDVNKYKFDLLVCDEGHRLKNSNIRTTQLLNQLDCDKRILLTGTPIQNDLQEFFALVDFVNPNALGSSSEFRKNFEDPILASRQPNANEEILAKGQKCAQELNKKTSLFLLRRTKEILDKYLPSKHEVVVFCKPTELQMNVYNSVIDSLMMAKENFQGFCDGVAHLGVIAALKKICSHPGLLKRKDSDEPLKEESITAQVLNEFPELNEKASTEDSSKLSLVVSFLWELKENSPKERVVLVSNSTQTLDLIAEVLDGLKFTSCRLDGSTPASQRSAIVDRFNTFNSNIFVFLLSSKAGGVGLNLTGASRLILFDSDWNPATDLQAMSRIWRDGQKHSVYIYRLLTTGTIEEKIYQRQINKQGLCDGIVDPQSARSIKLSQEELKEIFTPCFILQDCYTHNSLSCDCSKTGEIPVVTESQERSCQLGKQISSSVLKISELLHWEHHGIPIDSEILSELGLKSSEDIITFIFRNCST